MSVGKDIENVDGYLTYMATLPTPTLVVLYIFTPWTEFKTQMSAEISSIISRCPAEGVHAVSLISIDGKALPDVAKLYGVKTAPCIVLLRNEEVLEVIRGESDTAGICNAINTHAGADVAVVPSPDVPENNEAKDVLDEELVARLTKLVKTAPVMVFIKGTAECPQCRFSRRLVVLLRQHEIAFDSFNILEDEEVRQGLKTFGDWPTFPQLWVEGELLGGLEIVSIYGGNEWTEILIFC